MEQTCVFYKPGRRNVHREVKISRANPQTFCAQFRHQSSLLAPLSHARAAFSSAASLQALSFLQLRNYFQISPTASFHTYPPCLSAGVMTGPSRYGVKAWLLLPWETAFISCVGGIQLSSQISPLSLLDVAFQVDRKAEERSSDLPRSALNWVDCDGERSVSRALSLQLRRWAKQGAGL